MTDEKDKWRDAAGGTGERTSVGSATAGGDPDDISGDPDNPGSADRDGVTERKAPHGEAGGLGVGEALGLDEEQADDRGTTI